MTITISDFHGLPGPSFGKIQFGSQNDLVALDLENSRQFSFSIAGGDFYVSHSLIDQPGPRDWVNWNLVGTDVDAVQSNQNALPLGLLKWVRFELVSFQDVIEDTANQIPSIVQRVPTVYFRNMKTTRIVIKSEDTLQLRPAGTDIEMARVTSLNMRPGSSVTISDTDLLFSWFEADGLTRFYVDTENSNVVDVNYTLRTNPANRQKYPSSWIEAITLSAPASAQIGQSTTVTITALDAAGNQVDAEFVVTITARTP